MAVTNVIEFRLPRKISTGARPAARQSVLRRVWPPENRPAPHDRGLGDAPTDIDGLIRELAGDGMEAELRGLLAAVESDLQRLEHMSHGSSQPRTSTVRTSSVISPVAMSAMPNRSPLEPSRGTSSAPNGRVTDEPGDR